VQLTNNNDANLFLFCPLWSSDGKRIAYSAKLNNPSADGKIISTASVIDIETKTSKAVFQSENFQRLLGWTATEKELLLATINRKYGTELPTKVSLLQVNVETGEQRAIAKLESAYLYNIHLSFDRKVIAFAAHRDDKDNVWIMPASGGEAKKLTHNNDARLYFSSLAWSPDGRSLYFGKQSRFSLLSMITDFK
jgi:Tol biopolymer transport system component